MSICTLYKGFKQYRKIRKENNGKVLCWFVQQGEEPWYELLKPDKNGFATNKKGHKIIVNPSMVNIFGESLPQEIK